MGKISGLSDAKQQYIVLGILLVLLYIPLFHHIAWLPFRIWDEARLAHSAYEMYQFGHWLVPHFEGNPDMWSVKPPFLIWMQAIFMYLIGPGELAVRLPSAIAGLMTCLGLYFFFQRRLSIPWAGFLVAMVLVTTQGFVHQHATRTGDYDAMISLWLTLSSLYFFLSVEDNRKSDIYLFWITMSLGVLTKSIVALFLVPAYIAYLLLQRKLKPFITNRHTWFGLMVFVLIVAAYYLGRETINPGYLRSVWDNELGGRFTTSLDAHKGDFWFYFTDIIRNDFKAWYLLFPCGIALGLFSTNLMVRKLSLYVLLLVVCFFLVISTAQTKLEWYDVPMYPFLAMGVALFLQPIIAFIINQNGWNKLINPKILLIILLFLVFIRPYSAMVDKTYMPEEYPHEEVFYRAGHFLQDACDGMYKLDGYTFLQVDYPAHNWFYIRMMQQNGVGITMGDYQKVQTGDHVVVFQDHVKFAIMEKYQVETLDSWYEVLLWRIGEPLTPTEIQ